jgi:hypothetical protein
MVAGLFVVGDAFGIAWNGHRTAAKIARLAQNLPEGVGKAYLRRVGRLGSSP